MINLLEEQFCLHRNPTIADGLVGCSDCGLGGKVEEIEKFMQTKRPPKIKDPVVYKVNEIIQVLNKITHP